MLRYGVFEHDTYRELWGNHAHAHKRILVLVVDDKQMESFPTCPALQQPVFCRNCFNSATGNLMFRTVTIPFCGRRIQCGVFAAMGGR